MEKKWWQEKQTKSLRKEEFHTHPPATPRGSLPGFHQPGNEKFTPVPKLRRGAQYRVCTGQATKKLPPCPPTTPRHGNTNTPRHEFYGVYLLRLLWLIQETCALETADVVRSRWPQVGDVLSQDVGNRRKFFVS